MNPNGYVLSRIHTLEDQVRRLEAQLARLPERLAAPGVADPIRVAQPAEIDEESFPSEFEANVYGMEFLDVDYEEVAGEEEPDLEPRGSKAHVYNLAGPIPGMMPAGPLWSGHQQHVPIFSDRRTGKWLTWWRPHPLYIAIVTSTAPAFSGTTYGVGTCTLETIAYDTVGETYERNLIVGQGSGTNFLNPGSTSIVSGLRIGLNQEAYSGLLVAVWVECTE